MEGLVIGLDLCEFYVQICCWGKEKTWTFPAVLCRKKDEELWYVGDEAYSCNLAGEGILIDKIPMLAGKGETVSIGDKKYGSREILREFLRQVLSYPRTAFKTEKISQMVITLPKPDSQIMDCLLYCADDLGIARSRFHVISHGESFLYYVLSQKKEIWSGQVGLFDLSQSGLCYYEMKVQRGLRQTTVLSDYEKIDDGITLDLLDTSSGIRMADKVLCTCAERLLAKKLFSAILLTGRGFEKPSWASDFMKVIGRRRKVFGETVLFARGAAVKAQDYQAPETGYPYVMICEGRLKSTISMEVIHEEKPTQLVIAASGDSWYEAKSTLEFILDNQDELVFQIQPLDSRKRYEIRMPLEGIPHRPNRTTRIQMKVGFLDEKTMAVMVQDKGFGELFPASDIVIRREIAL